MAIEKEVFSAALPDHSLLCSEDLRQPLNVLEGSQWLAKQNDLHRRWCWRPPSGSCRPCTFGTPKSRKWWCPLHDKDTWVWITGLRAPHLSQFCSSSPWWKAQHGFSPCGFATSPSVWLPHATDLSTELVGRSWQFTLWFSWATINHSVSLHSVIFRDTKRTLNT